MRLFPSLNSTTLVIALTFWMAGGLPGVVFGQVYVDPYDPYYDSYVDPYYDPYFGGNDYDDDFYVDTDPEIRARIIGDLVLSPFVDRDRIQVSVDNGIATLSGRVEDRSEMVDAVEIAYDAGAWRVRNHLRPMDTSFRSWVDMGDRELREEIEDELVFSPFVNANRVTVTVEDGVATLYGGVENKGEIADAVENAYEAGAKRVKSRMWVDRDVDLF
jgi:osmotically-inducible protein OsmY